MEADARVVRGNRVAVPSCQMRNKHPCFTVSFGCGVTPRITGVQKDLGPEKTRACSAGNDRELLAKPRRKGQQRLPFRGLFSNAIEMLQQCPANSQTSTEPQTFVSAKTCLESSPFPRNAVAEETVYFGFKNARPKRVLCPAHTHIDLNKWLLFLSTAQRERTAPLQQPQHVCSGCGRKMSICTCLAY